MINYVEKKLNEVPYQNSILLVTATELETNILHDYLKPFDSFGGIAQIFRGNNTYFFGRFGNFKVIHVQCGMGSLSRDSSIMTVNEAIEDFNPKFVLMIGIAFGINEEEQKVGDVIVSEAILPYNFKRVGQKKTVHRSPGAASSKKLLSRFKNLRTWQHFLPDNKVASKIVSSLLSGEELIDNIEHRNKLLESFPNAKGGEMEGAGIYSACDAKVDWILVKGICDFADGNKNRNKESNQKIAMHSAVSLCLELFSSKTIFEDFDLFALVPDEIINNAQVQLSNKKLILFDLYSEAAEPFYVKRNYDDEFNFFLQDRSIWLHGPTGCGKSNLIFRNLIINKKEFIQISLANCVGSSIDEFFREIYFELSAKLKGTKAKEQPKTFTELHKSILFLLDSHFKDKEIYLLLEEIPISADEQHKEFTQKICALLVEKNLVGNLTNVKFILSSLNNPEKHLSSFHTKVIQQLKIKHLSYWEENDIKKLVDGILQNLNLSITPNIFSELINKAKGSPRFIKHFFWNVTSIMKYDDESLRYILLETERELMLN